MDVITIIAKAITTTTIITTITTTAPITHTNSARETIFTGMTRAEIRRIWCRLALAQT
jgi:hypothetical protein